MCSTFNISFAGWTWAITTTIITVERYGIVVALLSVGIAILLTLIAFNFMHILDRLGQVGYLIVSRVMAILIAAIARVYNIWYRKYIFN